MSTGAAPIRQAVVLAGGRGSRLGATTADTPKPLLPVGGRPFVEWLIANLSRQGVQRVILTVGYRAEAFDAWLAGLEAPVEVSTFVEDEPLDTGGALTRMAEGLDTAFFVLNGDTVLDVDLVELGRRLLDSDADAAVALRRVDDAGRYGRVEVVDGRVTSFAEKATGGAGWINGGVYALRERALEGWEAPLSIERDLLPELVRQGRVVALPCDGFFIDIGVPASLREAQESVPRWWAEMSGAAP